MNKIDTDKFTLFHHRLTKVASDCEENWYLLKRILYEMEIEEGFDNPNVEGELQSALTKLQTMMDVLISMKRMTSTIASDYEELLKRHQSTLAAMEEYTNGLNIATMALFKQNQPQRVDVSYTNIAPISTSLQKAYGSLEVTKDE